MRMYEKEMEVSVEKLGPRPDKTKLLTRVSQN